MKTKFLLKEKNVNVCIKAFYCLDGEYISFSHNPLHNTTYKHVNVEIVNHTHNLYGIEYVSQLITIGNEEPIECEYLGSRCSDDDLIIDICQDWG